MAWAIPTFAVAGLGMGLGYSPLSLIVLREAPPETQGAASSALSLTDSLGTALGTGVTGAIVAASLRVTGEPADGPRDRRSRVAIAVGIGGFVLTRPTSPRTVPAPRPSRLVAARRRAAS